MAKQYKSLHPTKYYRDYLAHDVRPDGREVTNFRPCVVNIGSISTADGSAIAKVGRTSVVCGIKLELCAPKAETPDKGFIIPNVELPALCSSKFKTGPPSDQAQVATKIIDEVLKNSACIDLKDLCIQKDKLVWCLYADMICLDYDGSVIDACLLALVAALRSVSLPSVTYDPELENKTVDDTDRKPLPVHNSPASTTFAIFDDTVILTDPTLEEENLCSGVITVVVKDDELCSVLKPGGSPLTDDKLIECIKVGKKRGTLFNTLIETALKESNDK